MGDSETALKTHDREELSTPEINQDRESGARLKGLRHTYIFIYHIITLSD